MRLGFFGGTFDPIHYGHLLLAESCREQCGLDRILFMPAETSPHKRHHVVANGRDRLEMVRLAIAGHEAFEVSTLELDRGGISYTAETLEALHAEFADAIWTLLMGADSLHDFPAWHRPADICRLAQLAIVHRPDSPQVDTSVIRDLLPPEPYGARPPIVVTMPAIGISSSDIRARVLSGRSIRYQVPRAVEMYIQTQQLYRSSP